MASFLKTGGTVISFNAVAAIADTAGDESRAAARRRVLKAGVAAFNDRHITVACAVRDMSATGARLRAETTTVTIPDTFELLIATDGFEANCEVVWRRGTDIGVRFIGAPRQVSEKRQQVIEPVRPPQGPSLRRKPKPGV